MTEQQRAAEEAASKAEADDREEVPAAADGRGDAPDPERRPGGEGAGDTPAVTEDTVEALVRSQLSKALGGKRGMVEAAMPTLAFTVSYILTSELRLSIGLGVAAALFLGGIRLLQRSSVQYVLTSLFGIGIAAVFAMRSGNAADAFLPGIIYNAVYAVVLSLSVLVRWPAIGLMIGPFIGNKEDFTSWRSNPAVLSLASRLTWLLVLPCVIRVLVQYPLWMAETYGWADTFGLLGLSKIAMGWPLQVAAFAAMVWVLARGRTPLDEYEEGTSARGEDGPRRS
ncbi:MULTISPECIES: DUF3159 domain-containing protein [Nocardiopsis]|uniref:DUF3159 domain-containing protein n=1 Tax=Nocardiopsis sinuspersici TaxID=501010 RepID=A0A1V3C250_9ACTN|nr:MULTISPECIES: DUF3159 domain-containing protein [Nocardiopsis]OOC54470.1 hypothetical protein NOSIN_12185 [Nocardiopsis sinuspersici]